MYELLIAVRMRLEDEWAQLIVPRVISGTGDDEFMMVAVNCAY